LEGDLVQARLGPLVLLGLSARPAADVDMFRTCKSSSTGAGLVHSGIGKIAARMGLNPQNQNSPHIFFREKAFPIQPG
ncbi:MAG: hypothetical protein ACRDA8_06075, partial [Shewanella sp.]